MSSTLASVPFHVPFVIRGISAGVAAVGGSGSGIERGYRRRLMELGFLEGSVVRVIGAAPMGDPLDVELRGCRYSLRRAEAAAIRVERIADTVPEQLAAK